MTYIEIPLWLAICLLVALLLLMIHTIIGDILGKALWNYIKDKENKENE